MSAADRIAAARALIDPLTGHDEGPWDIEEDDWDGLHITTTGRLEEGYTPIAKVSVDYDEPFETKQQSCAPLIAASPTLRDTVADLADGWEAEKARADALAQENAKLKMIIARMDGAVPVADKTCDQPGITLSEAVQRQWPDLRIGDTP